MAKTTRIVFVDDLDGSEGATTHTFSLNGDLYEIDLSPDNTSKLFECLAPLIAAGRKIGGEPKKGGKPHKKGGGHKIRQWAAENGFTVSSRGRIPAEVRAAYNHANHH